MNQRTLRFFALLLSLAMVCALPGLTLASSSLDVNTEEETETFIPQDLTPEELAQWEQWALEEAAAEKEGAQNSTAANAEAMTPEEEAAVDELLAALDNHTPVEEVDLSNLDPNEALPSHVFNILLLGVDNRTVELQRGLSDAVIICSVNMDTGSVKLTSFARDLAVSVPGYTPERRINVAYRYGGPELSMKTINRAFQMNIQHYVVVNIHGLADIIDALGGVDIEMTKLEAGRINFELRKEPMDKVKRENVEALDGVQHLDGMQAVTFARIRGIDSDLERTGRQRRLLETLLSTVMKDMDITKFVQLLEIARPHGDTNLTGDQLLSLGMAVLGGEAMENLRKGEPIMEQLRIPMDNHYGYKKFGSYSLLYLSPKNLKLSIETIHQMVYGQTYLAE